MLRKNGINGIFYMLLSGLTFVVNDSMLKIAMLTLPPYEVVALRGTAGIIFALGLLHLQGNLRFTPAAISKPVLLRASLECVAILTYIIALAHAPIGDTTAIFQTTPLLVILGMIIIYREKTSLLQVLLVLIGFAGAMMVAQPGQGTISPFVLLAFITAIFAAMRDLAARKIAAELPALMSTLVLIITVWVGALAAGAITQDWVWPGLPVLGLTITAGLFMMFGHHFTLLAYRNASAQAVAPFYYSFMLFAVLAGYFFFSEIPNWLSLVGMAIIVVSGLALLRLEAKKPAH